MTTEVADMARQQPRKTSGDPYGRARGGKPSGRRKAVPRDMQDQQAGAENVRNPGERTGGTGGSGEPRTDEPPD
ncbi:hypothetical protein [Streptomyces abikoensis]|uniref:hypothetical protein n=1 Tax=Streptomyces abikoensis TaxID=97398 RepID=UPI0033E321A9